MADKLKATEEQLVYAKLLDSDEGRAAYTDHYLYHLCDGYIRTAHPGLRLPKYWSMPVHQYLEATVYIGMGMAHYARQGDFLNFTGIAFLALVTLICYVRIVPILFRKKDTIYGVLAIVEVLILALAASGVLKSGGH